MCICVCEYNNNYAGISNKPHINIMPYVPMRKDRKKRRRTIIYLCKSNHCILILLLGFFNMGTKPLLVYISKMYSNRLHITLTHMITCVCVHVEATKAVFLYPIHNSIYAFNVRVVVCSLNAVKKGVVS